MGASSAIATAIIAAVLASPGGQGPAPGRDQAYGQGSVQGRASVVDGDTIEVQGRRVRLFGIDAPESSQSCEDATGRPYPCGRRAAMALDELIGGGPVSCQVRDFDRYGRAVAVCRSRGVDLNGRMVLNGQAKAFTRYGGDYAGAEREARMARRGIWAGRFEDPSDYRASHRR